MIVSVRKRLESRPPSICRMGNRNNWSWDKAERDTLSQEVNPHQMLEVREQQQSSIKDFSLEWMAATNSNSNSNPESAFIRFRPQVLKLLVNALSLRKHWKYFTEMMFPSVIQSRIWFPSQPSVLQSRIWFPSSYSRSFCFIFGSIFDEQKILFPAETKLILTLIIIYLFWRTQSCDGTFLL